MPASTRIVIFAKAPIPGYAKTRLIPALGETGAARLHKKLVERAVSQAVQVKGINLELHISEAHPYFLKVSRRHPITLVQQTQGDLGARMQHVFSNSNTPTLLMGSDCPCITNQTLERCMQSLEKHSIVILPAEDGGYGLIGIKKVTVQLTNALFKDIPWGTSKVMQQTRAQLNQLKVQWVEPESVWDIDHPEDLKKLERVYKKPNNSSVFLPD